MRVNLNWINTKTDCWILFGIWYEALLLMRISIEFMDRLVLSGTTSSIEMLSIYCGKSQKQAVSLLLEKSLPHISKFLSEKSLKLSKSYRQIEVLHFFYENSGISGVSSVYLGLLI